jgi:hypothetical protein
MAEQVPAGAATEQKTTDRGLKIRIVKAAAFCIPSAAKAVLTKDINSDKIRH